METKIDLRKIDLSKAADKEVLDKIDNWQVSDLINKLVEEEGKRYAEFHDKCVLKSAFYKAALYDLNCNPYTVSEHEKKKNIRDFCSWFISHIEDAKLNKREIIKELERYSEYEKENS